MEKNITFWTTMKNNTNAIYFSKDICYNIKYLEDTVALMKNLLINELGI